MKTIYLITLAIVLQNLTVNMIQSSHENIRHNVHHIAFGVIPSQTYHRRSQRSPRSQRHIDQRNAEMVQAIAQQTGIHIAQAIAHPEETIERSMIQNVEPFAAGLGIGIAIASLHCTIS